MVVRLGTTIYRGPITRPDKSIIPSTDYRTGCRNVSHYQQQQQSCSGLRSPGRSKPTFEMTPAVQTFHSKTSIVHDSSIDSSGSQSDRTSSFKIEFKMSFERLQNRGISEALEHARIQKNVSSLDPFTEQ